MITEEGMESGKEREGIDVLKDERKVIGEVAVEVVEGLV